MNVNPDPRPGRWLLPLVVLGMVAFTYVFVNQLPGEGVSTESTVDAASGPTSSTSVPDGSDPDQPGTTSESPSSTVAASPEVAAYVQAMSVLGTELTGFQAELSEANSAWEAGGSYSEAQTAFTQVRDKVAEWRDRVTAVSVPEGMGTTHDTLVQAANQAANQAEAALDGLVNSSGPEKRQQSVTRFDEAVSAFTQAVSEAGG